MTIRELKNEINSIPEQYLDNGIGVDDWSHGEDTADIQTQFYVWDNNRILFSIVTNAGNPICDHWDELKMIKED